MLHHRQKIEIFYIIGEKIQTGSIKVQETFILLFIQAIKPCKLSIFFKEKSQL